MTQLIYHMCPFDTWAAALAAGTYNGTAQDLADGFIHFSTAAQVAETAAKHFARLSGLMLVAVDGEALGPALKWERSRGNDLFPHLYATLPLSAVHWARPLPDEIDGQRAFSELKP